MPTYHFTLWGIDFSQTLIASVFGTLLFSLFLLIYTYLRRRKPHNRVTNLVDMWIESITKFFQDLWENIPLKLIKIVVFIFIYILRCNIIGLIWDLFVLAAPGLHSYFRPVSTDVFFNMVLAFVAVAWAMVFGFQKNGFKYIQKYIWYKGLGIVHKVTGVGSFIWKIFDIIIGLFIWLIEFVGEIARVISLSLRLFWNILAGMVLLGLVVYATQSFIKIPFLFPLVVVFFELFVGFLQAFVFSMLVLVYFKMAGEWHVDH